MKQSACSAVICQPGGREQKHDINKFGEPRTISVGPLVLSVLGNSP